MTTFRSVLCSFAFFLVASAPLVLAQGTYTQIDVPGATLTVVLGIDAAGEIVGYYEDGGKPQGFLLSGGVYATVNYPGASQTILFGLNNLGKVVGQTILESGVFPFGFVYDVSDRSFKEVAYPGAVETMPTAINDAGVVGGQFEPVNGDPTGFESDGSNYLSIVPPGQVASVVVGVAASGELLGKAARSFAYYKGQYRPVTTPPDCYAFGVNPAGTAIVVEYLTGTTVSGCLYQNKTLTLLQFPGSNNTSAYGINSAGAVVGYFIDASGDYHGFLWTPPAPVNEK